jgi:hypothetical protein
MRIVAAIGLAAFAAGMPFSLSVLSAKAQYPLGQSGRIAPPVPPDLDRALDCRNPRDAPLCREIQRDQAARGGAPPSAYRAPSAVQLASGPASRTKPRVTGGI